MPDSARRAPNTCAAYMRYVDLTWTDEGGNPAPCEAALLAKDGVFLLQVVAATPSSYSMLYSVYSHSSVLLLIYPHAALRAGAAGKGRVPRVFLPQALSCALVCMPHHFLSALEEFGLRARALLPSPFSLHQPRPSNCGNPPTLLSAGPAGGEPRAAAARRAGRPPAALRGAARRPAAAAQWVWAAQQTARHVRPALLQASARCVRFANIE